MGADINSLLINANSFRFKLLVILGKNEIKKNKIIAELHKNGWTLVDVEKELMQLRNELDSNNPEAEIEIGAKIKEWFNAKPNKLILTNASILYHDMFLKMSPIGAFKYNSRNKNCLLFLEDEQKLGSRLYYSQAGKEDYYDREIKDIVLNNIDDIDDHIALDAPQANKIAESSEIPGYAISHLFNFNQIKDVIDIDADLREVDKQKALVGSFIISESLEREIIEFFQDLGKPTHKARSVIGNYGSGKSHLVGFLVSLVNNPILVEYIHNDNVRAEVSKFFRTYLTVQFELQSGNVELKRWFYGSITKQLLQKYNLAVPSFDPVQDYDDKENIIKIVELVKAQHPEAGLLVVIDEISDFLAAKPKEPMKSDLQFLRVLGQICQDQDIMFLGSMQEDVFTSNKFKDVGNEISRISERFRTIIIHREDIKRVISNRIVRKSPQQRDSLE